MDAFDLTPHLRNLLDLQDTLEACIMPEQHGTAVLVPFTDGDDAARFLSALRTVLGVD